jgi:hypothetical protein
MLCASTEQVHQVILSLFTLHTSDGAPLSTLRSAPLPNRLAKRSYPSTRCALLPALCCLHFAPRLHPTGSLSAPVLLHAAHFCRRSTVYTSLRASTQQFRQAILSFYTPRTPAGAPLSTLRSAPLPNRFTRRSCLSTCRALLLALRCLHQPRP